MIVISLTGKEFTRRSKFGDVYVLGFLNCTLRWYQLFLAFLCLKLWQVMRLPKEHRGRKEGKSQNHAVYLESKMRQRWKQEWVAVVVGRRSGEHINKLVTRRTC